MNAVSCLSARLMLSSRTIRHVSCLSLWSKLEIALSRNDHFFGNGLSSSSFLFPPNVKHDVVEDISLIFLVRESRSAPYYSLADLSFSNMWSSLQGAMALGRAKSFLSDAGIPIPGGQGGGGKDDAKISAKVAKRQAEIDEQKKMRSTKDDDLKQRQKERVTRQKELEKARGVR